MGAALDDVFGALSGALSFGTFGFASGMIEVSIKEASGYNSAIESLNDFRTSDFYNNGFKMKLEWYK